MAKSQALTWASARGAMALARGLRRAGVGSLWGDGLIDERVADVGRSGAMALGLGEAGDGCGILRCVYEIKRICLHFLNQNASLEVARKQIKTNKAQAV